jgi:hypothetical protein
MGQAGIIILGLSVDFDRYYLPLVLTFAVGLGFGAGQVAEWLRAVAPHWSRPFRSAPSIEPGPMRAD